MTIDLKIEFEEYMKKNGPNDPESQRSYLSYLNTASRNSEVTISSLTCSSDEEIEDIIAKCAANEVDPKTLKNIRSALRKYARMVSSLPKGINQEPHRIHEIKRIMGTMHFGGYDAHLTEKSCGAHAIAINSLSGAKIALLTISGGKLDAKEFWTHFQKNVQSVWG